MAELLLSSAGQAIGTQILPNGLQLLGTQVSGAAIGQFLGAATGSLIDRHLFGQGGTRSGPRLTALPLQASSEGAPIPLVFGRARLAGQVIWASRFTETASSQKAGGKGGGPRLTRYAYSISLAVGLCQGPIDGLGRIWANGEVLDLSGLDYRLYKGDAEQLPDALIQAVEGIENAPAFRDLAYVVFEDLPLEAFGNRIPSFSFEVFNSPKAPEGEPRLETLVRGVDLIPASGEFAYSTTPVFRRLGPGREQAENINNLRGQPDLVAAIDDLETQLPNCRSVLLVSAWFGDDLRCGQCRIRPGVETRNKVTRPYAWGVAGESRDTAYLISQAEGQAVYGGTPSDRSLIEAISLLKARGFSVSLYPFILMDIPSGNALPDPYGGVDQEAFPWRGRITCHPAAQQPASADKTSASRDQVDDFFGQTRAADFSVNGEAISYSGPADWRFCRFILHHAALAKAAGGVDGFLIGTEMRGLTTIRDEADRFPAVDHLIDLASDVRTLLGPTTRLSYAADWSEYFGYQPEDGSGDVFFHLDALWANANIDAIAIDWYAPLSDWRDGTGHVDTQLAASIYERDYLSGNVEGGEGYDWYYASQGDRDAQYRSAITDGAYQKPWVYRYKDLRNWWGNPHHNRLAGAEVASPTAWVPESKPIWFTELGCPAVNKGANQPNVFIDAKSSESAAPYYSNGERDDLIQRRYIETILDYWNPSSGQNPVSSLYGGPMVDADLIHVWTWDARPFPDFPARSDIWADGENWRRGHWLNGRAGVSPLGLLISDICHQVGLEACDVSQLEGLVPGFVVDRPMAAREALLPLSMAYQFMMVDRSEGPVFISIGRSPTQTVSLDAFVSPGDTSGLHTLRADGTVLPRDVRLSFLLDSSDYRSSAVYAREESRDLEAVLDVSLPILADSEMAKTIAQTLLSDAQLSQTGQEFTLPPSHIALEAGDQIAFNGHAGLTIEVASGVSARSLQARKRQAAPEGIRSSEPVLPGDGFAASGQPEILLADMPLLPGETSDRNGLFAAAYQSPWPGRISLWAGPDASQLTLRSEIQSPSVLGEVTSLPGALPEGRWVEGAKLGILLYAGSFLSADKKTVLNGSNRLAIIGQGRASVIQFTTSDLVGAQQYELSGLLLGAGADLAAHSVGDKIVDVSGEAATLPVGDHERESELTIIACPSGEFPNAERHLVLSQNYSAIDARPLSPVHIKARRTSSGFDLSWIRRSRKGGDDWAALDIPLGELDEIYEVQIFIGPTLIQALSTTEPAILLNQSDLDMWSGAMASPFEVAIRQVSQRYGPGQAAYISLTP